MEIITATTDISKSEVQNKDVVIIGGGSGGFGKTRLMLDILEKRSPSVGMQLRGDVVGMPHTRPAGNNSFRYLPIVGGVQGAAKKRAKRKAEKKARKQSRK